MFSPDRVFSWDAGGSLVVGLLNGGVYPTDPVNDDDA